MQVKRQFLFFITCVCLGCQSASALTWDDLWWRADQQGAALLRKGKAIEAAKRFSDPNWRGVSYYRAGQYKMAKEIFKKINTSDGFYNMGNALAHQGQYEAAIKAYDQSLALDETNADAKANRELLKKLLKNKKQSKSTKPQSRQNQQKTGQPPQNKNEQKKQAQKKEKKQPEKVKSKLTEQQREKQQAKQQWLDRIPDDPGGLLRHKFLRDYIARHPRMQR